jgi:very-short-patch-repair endonuclease
MSEERRAAQREGGKQASANLLQPAEGLKIRERWKYAALEAALGSRPHEFEYPLGGYVFDLALFDTKTLVEFDGSYHASPKQRLSDRTKDEAAEAAGFSVVRRAVRPATAVPAAVILGL